MSKFDHKSIWLLTAGNFYAFFIFGFIDNLKGPTLPALLRDLDFSYSQGGTILLGAYFGFLVATLLTGPLADFAGKPAPLLVAGLALLGGIAGYSFFASFWLLTLAMLVLGLGLGSIEVGSNTIIVDLHSQQKGRYLNLLALFHGFGSLLTPLYAGQLLASDFTWRQIYQFSLALVLLLPLCFLLVKYPGQKPAGPIEQDRQDWWRLAFTRQMNWFYLLVGVYVAAEIGLASWLVEFLQQAKAQSIVTSSLFLALFFGGIMVGRFLGSFLVERVGYLKIMLLASLAATVCLALGTFGPPGLAFFLPLTGLFFSIMFPTITAAVSDLHQQRMGTILGFLFACGGLGGMVGPWLIGLTSDWLGLTWGFSSLLLFCGLTIIALLALQRQADGG